MNAMFPSVENSSIVVTGGTGSLVNASNVGRWPYPTRFGPLVLREVYGLNGACLGGPSFVAWLRCVGCRRSPVPRAQ